jgi:hypothetical protein
VLQRFRQIYPASFNMPSDASGDFADTKLTESTRERVLMAGCGRLMVHETNPSDFPGPKGLLK